MDAKAAAALLRGWDRILILTHKRPDGDTVGCAVGLCALLRQLGKTAWVLEDPDAIPLLAAYLEGYAAPAGWGYEKVVSVDVATLDLLTGPGRAIADSRGVDLAIDHHPSNTGFGRENWVEAGKAACGEVLYRLVGELGTLTPEIALPLYVAVSTDTGCFLYSNTTPNTHRVAAALMEQGIDFKEVNKRHFRTKSVARMKLEGLIMERLRLYLDGTLAVAPVSLDMLEQVGATEADTDNISAFAGQIEGVLHSATLREYPDGTCRVSLRTVPELLNATAVCALLGGGGHRAASGCTVRGTVEDAERAVLAAITAQLGEDAAHG